MGYFYSIYIITVVQNCCKNLSTATLIYEMFIALSYWQINPINKYLNSREYKLMFKKDLFKDKDESMKKVTSIIKSQVESQGGTFNSDVPDEEKLKKVWYLDSKNHKLCEVLAY